MRWEPALFLERERMSRAARTARTPGKWAILFTVLIMTFMATLDSSIVNVALPVMQKALDAGLDQIQWVSSVYLLAARWRRRLGDLYGKVRFFEVGVIIFSLGSLLCGISTTLPALVASRIVQGIGGASAMANNMGIITEAFPARERGRALGLLASFVALGMMCGPVLGGFIVSYLPWSNIFLINVPVGIASVALGRFTLPGIRARGRLHGRARRRADRPGPPPLVPRPHRAPRARSWLPLAALALGIALLGAVARHERRGGRAPRRARHLPGPALRGEPRLPVHKLRRHRRLRSS